MKGFNIKSVISSATNFLSRGWDLIVMPSKAQCEAYTAQASFAQAQLQRNNLSRRERKYWTKRENRAMNGLDEVRNSNSDTFVKVICAIVTGLLIGCKLLDKK